MTVELLAEFITRCRIRIMNSATNAMMKVDNASFGPDHSRIPHNSIPSREPDTPMHSYHLDYGALRKTWQTI